jgi:hypothetical protein
VDRETSSANESGIKTCHWELVTQTVQKWSELYWWVG